MRTYDAAPGGTVQKARRLRRDATEAEKRLWNEARRAFPGVKFRRQSPVGPYIVDFLCFAEKLVIEVDGGQHAENAADARRTAYLEGQGFRVIRFWNNEVLSNTAGVLQAIDMALSPSPRPSPAGRGS